VTPLGGTETVNTKAVLAAQKPLNIFSMELGIPGPPSSFSAIMHVTGSARELLFGTKQLPQNFSRHMPKGEHNQQPK
jgi:hypothetical protein